ncbi:MAG: nuclear transport factor 2 family protein [Pyrinomonadaceae bacterium]|nr:nuclear transport factor 2 family protein [Pyrinomonadaceae bacterium]
MKILSILFILIGFVAAVPAQKTAADKPEKELAKVPLENYLQAQATGNPEFIRKAFHADARIMAFRDGKLLNLSVEEFAGRFNGKASADEANRKRTIESLEISGNAAIAKIVLDYPTVKFTDYMSLLKIDGEWKIVNKSFYAEVKEQPKK